jgi:hypothetical protein
VTPTPVPTTVRITKECVSDDATTEFAINVSGAGLDEDVTLNCGESSAPTAVQRGIEHTVSETPPLGHAEPSIRGLCDGDGTFTLAAGASGTCVVGNTKLASVSIMKECASDNDTNRVHYRPDRTGRLR